MIQHNTYYSEIIKCLSERSILDAIMQTKNYIASTQLNSYISDLDLIETTYNYMLKYISDGINDPQRTFIYNKIICELYNLADRIEDSEKSGNNSSLLYSTKRAIKSRNLEFASLIVDYTSALKKYRLQVDSNADKEQRKQALQILENYESDFFKLIWGACNLSNDDCKLIADMILVQKNVPEHFKCLLLSGAFLSVLAFYDTNKILLLLDVYEKSNVDVLQVKSIFQLFLLSQIYADRFSLDTQILARVNLLKDNTNFDDDMSNIILQLVKSNETERINKKMREEVIPELMKLSPKIYNKINKSNIKLTEDDDLSANPDWQNILDKSGISKKIKELNEMQLNGADVFMSTFSHLKHFPFFYNIENWFLPFYKHHSMIANLNINDKLVESLIETPFLCDNDKYSFIAATASLPNSEKDAMFNQFQSQNIAMKEMKASELNSANTERSKLFSTCMQDYYRFFKLFSRKNEFVDPYTNVPFINDSILLPRCKSNIDKIRVTANFFFEHKYYEYAIQLFNILETLDDSDSDIFQKLGYCYQLLGNIDKALSYYIKADLMTSENPWVLKRIAFCYKVNCDFDKALQYYKMAELLEPDNLVLSFNIATSYIYGDKPKEALKYLYKIDYIKGNTDKTSRAIAWCEFLLDNYSQSMTFFNKIDSKDFIPQDYINMGHLSLVQNKNKDAIVQYKKCLASLENNFAKFKDMFINDVETLYLKGIDKTLIPMILDCVKD